jgi:hypothetical protein
MPTLDCIGGKASPKLEREKRIIKMELNLLKSKTKKREGKE